MESLRDFSQRYLSSLPNVNDMHSLQIGVSTTTPLSLAQQPIGVRLATEGNKKVLALRTNGFAFELGAPYPTWEEFSAEASKYWSEYVREFHPSSVTRYAVRYINRIVIPEAPIEADKYFNLRPEIPDDLDVKVDQLFMQLRFKVPKFGDDILVTSNVGLAEPTDPTKMNFILDFDVVGTNHLPIVDSVIFEHLNKLRDLKNELFELSITDDTRRLFS